MRKMEKNLNKVMKYHEVRREQDLKTYDSHYDI